jgi:ABC-type dipeptide/oligopeptide/nickel transport system permease subunit
MVRTWNRITANWYLTIGGSIILFLILTSLIGPFIAPDKSPMANEMNIELANQRPGFSIYQWLVSTKNGDTQRIFSNNYEWHKDTLIIYPYLGENEIPIIKEKFLFENLQFEQTKSGSAAKEQVESQFKDKKRFILGSDRYGRDVLSRLIGGARISLSVGIMAVVISLIIGTILGLLAGYYRGWIDELISWFINVIWSLPALLLVIAISFVLGKGYWQVFIAVGLSMWVEVARIVRGQVLSLREKEYIEAGKALGFSDLRIITKHILPNSITPILVVATSNFAAAILLEAGLSFLGFGAQPPMPSWGNMIKEHYGYIVVGSAYLAILPGLAIMICVFAFNMISIGFRDFVTNED